MIKIFLLATLVALIASADPKFPVWAPRFQQQFVESYTKAPSFRSLGHYYYDSVRKMSRIERGNGIHDSVCGSSGGGSTLCVQLVRDEKRYVIYPLINKCCFCCDASHGCGVLRRDWPSQGYVYKGVDELSGQFFDRFRNEEENSDYWVTRDTRQISRRLSYEFGTVFEDFIMNTYREDVIPDFVFALPGYCSDKVCPKESACTQMRQRKSQA